MYVDRNLLFSDGQDLSQTEASYYSSNALDLGSTLDLGKGEPMTLVVCVDEAFDSAGAATLKIEIIDEEDKTLDGSSIVIVSTRALAYTLLTLGVIITLPIPAGIITQQFIGVKYTIGGATTTAGTVTAFLALDAQLNP